MEGMDEEWTKQQNITTERRERERVRAGREQQLLNSGMFHGRRTIVNERTNDEYNRNGSVWLITFDQLLQSSYSNLTSNQLLPSHQPQSLSQRLRLRVCQCRKQTRKFGKEKVKKRPEGRPSRFGVCCLLFVRSLLVKIKMKGLILNWLLCYLLWNIIIIIMVTNECMHSLFLDDTQHSIHR